MRAAETKGRDELAYLCQLCMNKFTSTTDRYSHISYVHGLYWYDTCKALFSKMGVHMNSKTHIDNLAKEFQRSSKDFTTLLPEATQVDEEPEEKIPAGLLEYKLDGFPCTVCPVAFSTRWHLICHHRSEEHADGIEIAMKIYEDTLIE